MTPFQLKCKEMRSLREWNISRKQATIEMNEIRFYRILIVAAELVREGPRPPPPPP